MKEKWTPHIIAVMALAVFIVLGLACASEPESNEPESAKMHFERGKKIFEEKKNIYSDVEAINEFDQAIKLDPNFVEAYIYRARVNMGSNRQAAEADCNKAIELDPQKFAPYYFRGLIYQEWGKAEISSYFVPTTDNLSKAIEYYDRSLSDFNKALERNTDSNNQQLITNSIAKAKEEKGDIETSLANSIARESANKYDKSKFIIVPSDFYPANYTKADLFEAVAASEKLGITPQFWMGNTPVYPSKDFVSDVLFVSQNGTDITFRTADNAINKRMKVDSRTGLTAGQKVRIYYTASRVNDWTITAIERL